MINIKAVARMIANMLERDLTEIRKEAAQDLLIAAAFAYDRIAQLEADLAEARKDQARYQTMRKAIVNCDRKVEEILLQNLTDAGGNDEFDAAVDLAIKEQQ